MVQFGKGSTKMFWKDNVMETEFRNGEFLQKKFLKVMSKNDGLPTNKVAKGFPIEKKVDVIQKLCPLTEESRKGVLEKHT